MDGDVPGGGRLHPGLGARGEPAQRRPPRPHRPLLRPQGRLVVISFHSLEDRIVKNFFRHVTGKTSPKDAYGNPIERPQAKLLFRKGIAGKEHDISNPRARSARLRVIEKLPACTST